MRLALVTSIQSLAGLVACARPSDWVLRHCALHGNLAPLIGASMLCGLGFGLFNAPNNRTMFLSAPLDRSGAAGGMQGSARLLGQTTGTLLMTLLFALVAAAMAPRLGLACGGGLTLAAGLVSLMRRESGTQATRDALSTVQEIRS